MCLLLRRDGGRPIRAAMDAAGLSGPDVAQATRTVDPAGKGVSPALVGFLTGTGRSARDRCRLWSGWLIAEALHSPVQDLFMPSRSTSTEERSTHGDEDDR